MDWEFEEVEIGTTATLRRAISIGSMTTKYPRGSRRISVDAHGPGVVED
jgi:hypothetical protein